jgi:class 3 adenylate cyclase/tetratricopeptide (TPR) repeat protein
VTIGAHRKVVTVLFCDVVGSTALGESVDPEALQGVLAAYFERMKEVVEAHGGSVEKFIGDAVMAVFGVPVAHEDDALRACRAAVEMRDALPALGVEGRIGVNSGEVLVGTEERLATGDAVNLAARLEQAAQSNEVLVGETTLELVRGAVQVEPVEPLDLKGKAESVSAHRLVAVLERPERSHVTRFVGREPEVELIAGAWKRVLAAQRCELVTIVGEAGVGKSRLVAEALASIEARVVRGRCLPYGEGITYWPVVDVVKQLEALPSDPSAAAAIRSLLGESDASTSAEEIAWAFRKLLEEQAPLVVVLDDIHWGEQAFLDLVEGVALMSSTAPILLVCMARPELLAQRFEWQVSLRLQPLPEEVAGELISSLPSALRKRIARAAGGNPLFLTEMLAMASETEDVEVPASLRALLVARIDQLDPPDRAVLECGAVEGELFHRGAVQELAPEGTPITPRLATLVRKEVIRADRPQLQGEDGFRFRHLLIRDTAYHGLPKAFRADLHVKLARWLQNRDERLADLDEIVGYHLAQAYSYRAELGSADSSRPLADEAIERLATAGRRAADRRDLHAAAALFRRGLSLADPGSSLERSLGIELASVLIDAGGFEDADDALRAVERAGEAAGDAVAVAHARLGLCTVAEWLKPEGAAVEARRQAEAAMPIFEAVGDQLGMAKAWLALGLEDHMLCRWEGYREANERALAHLRSAGDRNAIAETLSMIAHAVTHGPTPVPAALARLDGILDEMPDNRMLRSRVQLRRGYLLALIGEHQAAVAAELESEAILSDLGNEYALGSFGLSAGGLEHRLGRLERAEQVLRRADEIFQRAGERNVRSTALAELAHVFLDGGRLGEAEQSALLALELGSSDDIGTVVVAEAVLARIEAGRGEKKAAERSAAAVAMIEATDMLAFQGNCWQAHAEVLTRLGNTEQAQEASREAVTRFERKGALTPDLSWTRQ